MLVCLSCPVQVKNERIALTNLLKTIHVVFLVFLPLANLRHFENLNQPAKEKGLSLPVNVTAAAYLRMFIIKGFYCLVPPYSMAKTQDV